VEEFHAKTQRAAETQRGRIIEDLESDGFRLPSSLRLCGPLRLCVKSARRDQGCGCAALAQARERGADNRRGGNHPSPEQSAVEQARWLLRLLPADRVGSGRLGSRGPGRWTWIKNDRSAGDQPGYEVEQGRGATARGHAGKRDRMTQAASRSKVVLLSLRHSAKPLTRRRDQPLKRFSACMLTVSAPDRAPSPMILYLQYNTGLQF
jgi:hypothetical protein